MSDHASHRKRTYSSIYKIYRRIRFIRYKKKSLKKIQKEIRLKELDEKKLHERQLRDFKKAEKKKYREKLRAEKVASRKTSIELKEEFARRKAIAEEEKKVRLKEKEATDKLLKEKEKKNRELLREQHSRERGKKISHFRDQFTIRSLKKRISRFRDNSPNRRKLYLITFNSTVMFLLAYFALYFLSQAATVIAAKFFSYPTIVYYYEIYFNIPTDAWYHDSVKTIFSAGPLLSFVLGIIMIILYSNKRESVKPFKLFFLWGFLHGVNLLFGAMLVGTLFEAGVGHVISWMYIMDTGKVLYSIFSIFLLVVAGMIATKQFLFSANTYYNEINRKNRTSFIFSQVLLPYLAGNIILFMLRQPRFVFYDTFISMTLVISILPILATYRSFNVLYFEEEEKKPRIVWEFLAILAFVMFFFRGIESLGIHLGG